MKNYAVKIPLAGHAIVLVEANSKEEAIEAAMMKAGEVEVTEDDTFNNDEEEGGRK